MFIFGATKQIALKIAIKSNYVLQKIFSFSTLRILISDRLKNLKNYENDPKNYNFLGSKTPTNDFLSLSYCVPSNFTNLSTWRTTKDL